MKTSIEYWLESATEEQKIFLGKLLNIAQAGINKGSLMDISFTEEERRKVDSAYPQPYADKIREILPNWKGHFNVYNYNKNTFGEMTNVAEEAITQIFKQLEIK